jgi:hypothetical protein
MVCGFWFRVNHKLQTTNHKLQTTNPSSTISHLCCRRTDGKIFSAQLPHTDFRHTIVSALHRIIRSRASEPTTPPTPTFLINHLTKGGYHGIQSFDQTTV